jgi:hypothetical protein
MYFMVVPTPVGMRSASVAETNGGRVNRHLRIA